MKTNLLAQNDSLVIENLKADVGKSVMDLSHSVTFPVDVDGAIYPICCIETLPSDSFEINVEILLRQLSPLKVPLMTNFRLNTAFYYCDNRLAWKKWDRFMTGGRSGNEVFDIPVVGNQYYEHKTGGVVDGKKLDLVDKSYSTNNPYSNISLKNTLHTYFGISLNHTADSYLSYDSATDFTKDLPVAFPFFDYQIICRDYYTNVDRLKQQPLNQPDFSNFESLTSDWTYENLFPSDDDEIRLVDGPQTICGWYDSNDKQVSRRGFVLDKIRYHDVRPDYFTTSKKAPMRGTAPTLSGNGSLVLPDGTKIILQKDTDKPLLGKNIDPETSVLSGTDIKVGTDHNDNFNPAYADGVNVKVENSASIAEYLYADTSDLKYISGDTIEELELAGYLNTQFTASDIRLLSQLTVWQELNMLHEPYYNDFLNAHFDNVRVGESPVEKPQYIGGTSQLISINEILQTSQTTTGESGSPLGNQGATAMSLASNHVGRYYSNNYGYIIGVAYIIPDLLYKPALPRGFSRRTKEDYYSPEFANLSMQATLNKEIFYSTDDDWNDSPWGYTGAYDELRSLPNRIAGDLLNPDYTDLQKWVLVREMDNSNKPSMSTSWLSLKGNVDETAWAVQNMPKFMLQCANYIKAVRPMPKVAIPKAL